MWILRGYPLAQAGIIAARRFLMDNRVPVDGTTETNDTGSAKTRKIRICGSCRPAASLHSDRDL